MNILLKPFSLRKANSRPLSMLDSLPPSLNSFSSKPSNLWSSFNWTPASNSVVSDSFICNLCQGSVRSFDQKVCAFSCSPSTCQSVKQLFFVEIFYFQIWFNLHKWFRAYPAYWSRSTQILLPIELYSFAYSHYKYDGCKSRADWMSKLH